MAKSVEKSACMSKVTPCDDEVKCRICHSQTTTNLIRSPCSCKGSMGYVHIDCLEQWLNASSQTYCELCSHRFNVVHDRQYSLCQSIRVWVQRDQGTIYKALFFFILSVAKLVLIGWMWFLLKLNAPQKVNRPQLTNTTGSAEGGKIIEMTIEEKISLAIWLIVLVFLFLLTFFFIKNLSGKIRQEYRAWHSWWKSTVNVHLVLDLQNCKVTPKLEDLHDLPIKHADQEKLKNNEDEKEQLAIEGVKVLQPNDEGDDNRLQQNTNQKG